MFNPFKRKLIIPELHTTVTLGKDDILIIQLPIGIDHVDRILKCLYQIPYFDKRRVWLVPGELKLFLVSSRDEAKLNEFGLQKILKEDDV